MLNVQVLMSTYNGERYLSEQLESLKNQDFEGQMNLLIRDDGSKDDTKTIIRQFMKDNENVELIEGSNVGVIDSFFELIEGAGDYDFYALCDQDDVWDTNKLTVAVNMFDLKDNNTPMLYLSTTRNVDCKLQPIDEDTENGTLTVYNIHQAVMGNNATGCTMVFNSCLRELIIRYRPKNVIMHDHWIYLLCIACGGRIIYDSEPHISYRHHNDNVIGGKNDLKSKLKNSSFCGKKNVRSGLVIQLINEYSDVLTEESKQVLSRFKLARKGIVDRIKVYVYEKSYISGLCRRLVFLCQLLLGLF